VQCFVPWWREKKLHVFSRQKSRRCLLGGGEDNMVKINDLTYLWNCKDLGQWIRNMSHKKKYIRVINEKQLLLILVSKNNEVGSSSHRNWYYVDLSEIVCKAFMRIHRQARAGELVLLMFEEIWNGYNDNNFVLLNTKELYKWKSPVSWKVIAVNKGGKIGISDIWNFLHD
jgi:hypothetical protein